MNFRVVVMMSSFLDFAWNIVLISFLSIKDAKYLCKTNKQLTAHELLAMTMQLRHIRFCSIFQWTSNSDIMLPTLQFSFADCK